MTDGLDARLSPGSLVPWGVAEAVQRLGGLDIMPATVNSTISTSPALPDG